MRQIIVKELVGMEGNRVYNIESKDISAFRVPSTSVLTHPISENF